MKKFLGYTLILSTAIILYSCNKKDTSLNPTQLIEYMPLQPGKYIHYRLDSMRFIDFGQRDTVVSYDAKDVIDGEVTDNLGRQTFRVVRYLRDLSSTNDEDYVAKLTYFVTPTRESIEVQEENLKFQKLRLPVPASFCPIIVRMSRADSSQKPSAPTIDSVLRASSSQKGKSGPVA